MPPAARMASTASGVSLAIPCSSPDTWWIGRLLRRTVIRAAGTSPRFTLDDFLDCARAHPVLRGQTGESNTSHAIGLANNQDLSVCEYGQIVLLAMSGAFRSVVASSSLGFHVGEVYYLRTCEEMPRVNTGVNVTTMAPVITWKKGTMGQFNGHTMRKERKGFPGTSHLEATIFVGPRWPHPQPARSEVRANDGPVFVHIRPEADRFRLSKWEVIR